MPHKDTLSIEYDVAEYGDNPICTLVLDIDYEFTPEQPARLNPPPGEPGCGAEADMSGTFWLLVGTERVALPPPVQAWFQARVRMADYFDHVRVHAHEGMESMRDEADDMRRREGADHE